MKLNVFFIAFPITYTYRVRDFPVDEPGSVEILIKFWNTNVTQLM